MRGSREDGTGKRTSNLMYAASTALALVLLVIGATTLSNYGKMESMEKTLNHISANIEEQEHQVEEYPANEKEENKLVIETITGTVDGVIEVVKGDKEDSIAEGMEAVGGAAEEQKTEEVMSEVQYYIVQKGDTLGSISETVYASIEYIEEIQKANNIDDKDKIFEGQKLIMP